LLISVCLFHLLYHHFFSFFHRRFLSRLPADTPVTQLRVLHALLHKTKKGNHATAAVLHVLRVTSQLRPCLVLARGFAQVCAPCVKENRGSLCKKTNKKRKKRARGTIGSATPVGTRFGLAACLPSFVLPLVFFFVYFLSHL
jgi:hypothetical protein